MHIETKFINFLHALHQHRGQAHGKHSQVRESDNHGAHELFQSSTINALLKGIYDGEMTYAQLREHGNFGLGTFNGLDGEMIALDGTFYQIRSDGIANQVEDSQKTPFAVVQFFKPDFHEEIDREMDYEQLKSYLHRMLPASKFFYAIHIDGFFKYIKVRSVSRQIEPYPPLVDAVKTQSIFELHDVHGTLVGFRFPDYTQGVNVPGYHLHFITKERNTGGHVFEFQLNKGTAAIEHTSNFYMELPGKGTLPDDSLGKDQREAIRQAEE